MAARGTIPACIITKRPMNKKVTIGILAISMVLAGCQQTAREQEKSTTDTDVADTTTNTINNMQTEMPTAGDTVATIETDKGTIKVKLFTNEVPETTKNFIELAKAGKYDGVPFHRVIEGLMIQTGDFTKQNGTGGYSYKGPGTVINDEFSKNLQHLKGTLSMANSGPNSGGSQFFIVTADQGTPHLNFRHSVFGQVFEGQNIADEISRAATDDNDTPKSPITIKTIAISEY